MGEKMTGYYEIDGGNVCGIQFNGIGSLHESIRYHRYEKLKTISLPKLILFAQEVSDLVENGKIDEGNYNEAKQAVKKLTNFQGSTNELEKILEKISLHDIPDEIIKKYKVEKWKS